MLEEIKLISENFLEEKNQGYRRYFIETIGFKSRLSILVGQRGVGKTTTLIQALLEHVDGNVHSDEILYVQADHFALGELALYEIAEQFSKLGGRVIAFDEIHKYENWSLELKSIYDTFPDLTVLASGSSALEIYKGSHDLSRRAIIYKMQGMSFREFIELECGISLKFYSLSKTLNDHKILASEILTILSEKNLKVLPLFLKYLRVGYYPYYQELDETLYFITIEQNIHFTIESDLVAIYPKLTGDSIKKIKNLMRYIAGSVPFTPNWDKLKNTLGIGDVRTLKTYFKYLEDAGLVQGVPKASTKLATISQPEKIYLNDTNQGYAISPTQVNTGTLRETFFLSMLSMSHSVTLPAKGDFLVEGEYLFEVGGKNKSEKQVYQEKNAYLACDNIEKGINNKIPLWLFGFLY